MWAVFLSLQIQWQPSDWWQVDDRQMTGKKVVQASICTISSRNRALWAQRILGGCFVELRWDGKPESTSVRVRARGSSTRFYGLAAVSSSFTRTLTRSQRGSRDTRTDMKSLRLFLMEYLSVIKDLEFIRPLLCCLNCHWDVRDQHLFKSFCGDSGRQHARLQFHWLEGPYPL